MQEIRRLFPDSHISLLVRPWVADIYSAVDFVDEIIEYDKDGLHHGWPGFYRLIANLKSRRFDLAILLQNAFEAALIAWCARIPIRAGYARDGRSLLLTHKCRIDPAVSKVHQAHYYLGILSGLGLIEQHSWEREEYPLSIGIGVRAQDRNAAREMLRSGGLNKGQLLVGINPGAFYGEAKRWFPDRYAGVADWLVEQYGAKLFSLALFGSSRRRRSCRKYEALFPDSGRQKHTGQLMGLIKNAPLMRTTRGLCIWWRRKMFHR
jgi:heptosyltransferase-2